MNTWGAAHQNAAVFMRNLEPLVRAPQKVMRKKRKAVVILTVSGATAKDSVIQPQNQPPPHLPSLQTLPSPLQGQCSTKFLSPLPFLCLSGPECIHVATWGLNPWFDPSLASLSSLLCLIEERGGWVARDPGILTCCYSKTQTPGFSLVLHFFNTILFPGTHLGPFLPFILTAKLPVLGSS